MKMIKAIIVDDEEDARDVLKTLINFSQFPIEIQAMCKSLKEAVTNIKQLKPDVVFLDIQMPEYAGYEIVNFFDEMEFEIVFITAYDKYALKAFEMSAIDYLVKPINRTRLNESLQRISEKVDQKNTHAAYAVLLETLQNKTFDKIVIPEIDGNLILNLKDIICIQGYGSYVIIHQLNTEKLTVSKNLKYFEKSLPEESNFFRSQKSWIINLDHIKKYNANQGNIYLSNDIIAKLSPTKITAFNLAIQK
ncbi:hypothetical protein DNU06_00805 [Putridiphycobacter roseus]|uniref:DNA-binding response regulator n=1 Tax=Putridiphycobacter roseus TaxID=2219161 RepID=A0A2W1N297_9FLAO|nr:LytTR family DNA-binding domain-containing protein [Putridiphycobacter roseus]PZE18407.1 hypothetical protein DNU06_00805 [Putridiphycobacter roseus]